MGKSVDPLPRLMHECFIDLIFCISVGIGLMFVSVANSASINPPLKFQQDLQYTEYNRLAQVILKEAYRRIGQPIGTSNSQNIGLNDHQRDGVLIAPAGSYKNDYIRIPVAIVKLKVFAYVHKDHGNSRYEFGLLSNRIAIVEGMPIIAKNMMGMIAQQKKSVNTSFQSIIRNQVDLALLPEFSALKRASKHLRKYVVALQPAVYEVPMYHYINRKHKHLVTALMQSLKGMEKQQLIVNVTKSYKTILAADAEA
jgi:hypothetical protein